MYGGGGGVLAQRPMTRFLLAAGVLLSGRVWKVRKNPNGKLGAQNRQRVKRRAVEITIGSAHTPASSAAWLANAPLALPSLNSPSKEHLCLFTDYIFDDNSRLSHNWERKSLLVHPINCQQIRGNYHTIIAPSFGWKTDVYCRNKVIFREYFDFERRRILDWFSCESGRFS